MSPSNLNNYEDLFKLCGEIEAILQLTISGLSHQCTEHWATTYRQSPALPKSSIAIYSMDGTDHFSHTPDTHSALAQHVPSELFKSY